MFDTRDILETIEMIQQQNLDVRTITIDRKSTRLNSSHRL